jgi:hypothetical protein
MLVATSRLCSVFATDAAAMWKGGLGEVLGVLWSRQTVDSRQIGMAEQPAGHDPTGVASRQRLVRAFVTEARLLPHVQQVLLETGPSVGPTRIWTVISAPPFESEYRQAVYQAELCAYDAAPSAVVEFQLVNLDELVDPPDHVLPAAHRVVYQRSSST